MKKEILCLLAFSAITGFSAAQTDTTTLTKTGEKAPVFSCTTIDGRTIDISKMEGKVVLINFFATWCGPCNMELPVLQKNVWGKYKNNPNFILIIIGREHTDKEVSDFVAKKRFNMPFASDPKRSIFSMYATQTIPRNIIIGKDGRIVFQNSGYDPKEFKKLEGVLAEKLK